MKESNQYLEKPYQSMECLNHNGTVEAAEINRILDVAGKEGNIEQSEIKELTKIILKLNPESVDAAMQAKFAQIMGKVRAQFA